LPGPELTSAIESPQAAPDRHNQGEDPNRWLRVLFPSTADLIFALFLVFLATGPLAVKLLGDAGIGWHIRTGELIWQSKAVPRLDPFSSTMRGQPWYAWEWLYDMAVGALHGAGGLNAVVFFNALAIAATFAFVFRKMTRRGAGVTLAVVLLLFAAIASSVHFLARPHVFSWLFTLIWFELLRDYELDGNIRRLFWLPAIMLAWVNVHGGFLVGLVLLGVYSLAFILESLISKSDSRISSPVRKAEILAVFGVACAGVTLVNPYGYLLHVHIYRYLSDKFLMDHINEFLSPNFHGIPQKSFAIIILVTLAALATARQKMATSELLVILFAVYSGLYATRNMPVSALLLVMIVGPQLSRALANGSSSAGLSGIASRLRANYAGFERRMGALESRLSGHWLPIVTILVGGWVCLHGGRLGSLQAMTATFDGNRFPVQAVDWLDREGVRDPVFCTDSWGGYVIYREFPKLQVVIDDRHDLYGPEYLMNYLKVIRVEPGWGQALAATHASWILLPRQSAATTLLREVHAWTVNYEDKTAVLFRRTGSAE